MPTVTLSMIVRNAAATLGACLQSARDAVDEIAIADTGSSDSTIAIARGFGARVIEISWENDFAGARNRALAGVKGGWVLVLDADEILDGGAIENIRTLIAAPGIAGYQVPIRNYVLSLEDRIWDRPAKPNDFRLEASKPFPAYVEHQNVRLFRRDSRIYFVGRVHESVGPRIEKCGLGLGRAAFLIHHFGLVADADTRAKKNIFYRDLGKLKTTEMPENAQAHLELGLVELDNFGNVKEALECFERACELNPRFAVAWFFAGIAHARLGQHRESLSCLQLAAKHGRETASTLEATGDAHYNLGEFPEAVNAYRRGLDLFGYSAALESKLGLTSIRAGQNEDGLALVRNAARKDPGNGELHDRLVLSLVWLHSIPEAAQAAEDKLRSVKTPQPGDFARSASLRSKTGNWARATAMLHVGLQIFKEDTSLRKALEELSVLSGTQVGQLVETLSHKGIRTSGN